MSDINDINDTTSKILDLLLKDYITDPLDSSKYDRAFFKAIENKNMDIINLLLELNFPKNINITNDKNSTILMMAIIMNNTVVAKKLLEKSADIHLANINNKTALLYAANLSNNEICELLIAKGADINHQDNCKDSALIWAAFYNNLTLVNMLIAHGANFNLIDNFNKTALMWACERNFKDIVTLLVDAGANVNFQNKFKESAYTFSNDKSIINILNKNIKPLIAIFCVQKGQSIPSTKVVRIIDTHCKTLRRTQCSEWREHTPNVLNNVIRIPIDKNVKLAYHADINYDPVFYYKLDATTPVMNENNEIELLGDIYRK